jgi:hypothetical protein
MRYRFLFLGSSTWPMMLKMQELATNLQQVQLAYEKETTQVLPTEREKWWALADDFRTLSTVQIMAVVPHLHGFASV